MEKLVAKSIWKIETKNGIMNLGLSWKCGYIIFNEYDEGILYCYDLHSGEKLWSYDVNSSITCLSLSHDGNFIAVGGGT